MAKQKEKPKTNWEKFKEQYFELSPYIGILLFVVVCWLLWSRHIEGNYYSGVEKAEEKAGQLGDSYGVITSFFSALAFAGIAITIYLQRKELSETRKEFATQNATLKRQRFEGTFFNMLSIHFKIKENVDGIIAARIKMFISNLPINIINYTPERLEDYKAAFAEEVEPHLPLLSQHLQSLVAIHQLIKNNKFKPEVEQRYLTILSSYLSIPEKQFIFYFAVLAYTTDLKRAIYKLAPELIFNLTIEYLAHESHMDLYPEDLEVPN